MNTGLIQICLDILVFWYWFIFYTTGGIGAYLLDIKGREDQLPWTFIRIYRFLRPAKYLMLVVLYIWYVFDTVRDGFSFSLSLYVAIMTAIAIFDKDTFGDDTRQKKPSKVLATIKSLGHRLVVVPNG